jgi:hypothetical protein
LRYRSLDRVIEEVIMLTITEAAENASRLLSIEPLEPKARIARIDDAACIAQATRIAQAIAQQMDPEWREFVDQEQRNRSIASLGLSEAQPLRRSRR